MTNTHRIRRSLDFRYYLHSFLFSLLAWLIFLIALTILRRDTSALSASTTWVISVAVGAISVYYAARMGLLFTHAEDYRVYTARYKAVHISSFRRGMRGYYAACTLTLERPDGSTFEKKSHYVFPMSVLSSHHLGEYLDVPLEVLYREDTDRMIVVGRPCHECPTL